MQNFIRLAYLMRILLHLSTYFLNAPRTCQFPRIPLKGRYVVNLKFATHLHHVYIVFFLSVNPSTQISYLSQLSFEV